MNNTLLFEIGTEEIPAKFMPRILDELRTRAKTMLADARLSFASLKTVGTPRRLALIVEDLADRQPDLVEENRGPSVAIAFDENHNPTKAAQGFARGQGIHPSELIERDNYVYAHIKKEGQTAQVILVNLLPELIQSLQFPKSMKWGSESFRFVRPIRWLVALFNAEVIPFTLAGVSSGNTTRGHRFLGEENVVVPQASDYDQILREQHVIVDPAERRQMITQGLQKLAEEQHATVVEDEDLLTEIVFLVEYPTPLCGHFEERYLELPEAAVVTPMKDHQRYFPLRDREGRLLPLFLTVRNGSDEHLDTVQAGNERVLRARLADAEFFFNEDRKKSLADRYDALQRIVYQENLGTMQDKTERLQKITQALSEAYALTQEEKKLLQRATHLAKTDLATALVTEFTELQGEIGKEYALLDGEQEETAQAIFEQYLPRFAGDILPSTKLGEVLSLADKLDNIVATFSQGHAPTGSQDPFALRRQAIGIVQIAVQSKTRWYLRKMVAAVAQTLGDVPADVQEQVVAFIMQRLQTILSDESLSYDQIDAVLAGDDTDIYSVYGKAHALADTGFVKDMELRQAFRRVVNLAKEPQQGKVQSELFESDEEKKLYAAYESAAPKIEAAYANQDYASVYQELQPLVAPINEFFDHVIVMADNEEVRQNRLLILQNIAALLTTWFDIKKLVE